MARIRANKPIKVIRGKNVVNGPRKSNESSNKPKRVKRGLKKKNEVNESRKPKGELVGQWANTARTLANKPTSIMRSKDKTRPWQTQ